MEMTPRRSILTDRHTFRLLCKNTKIVKQLHDEICENRRGPCRILPVPFLTKTIQEPPKRRSILSIKGRALQNLSYGSSAVACPVAVEKLLTTPGISHAPVLSRVSPRTFPNYPLYKARPGIDRARFIYRLSLFSRKRTETTQKQKRTLIAQSRKSRKKFLSLANAMFVQGKRNNTIYKERTEQTSPAKIHTDRSKTNQSFNTLPPCLTPLKPRIEVHHKATATDNIVFDDRDLLSPWDTFDQ